jgi:type IX secretion system PorP/SprF family membrane protein
METKILRVCFFISMMSTAAYGQQNLFYNHYYVNPFLYNPSYVAPSGYTELYLNYRKQWSGISGAPTTGTLNLHLPLSHKVGVAVTAWQDEAGLLKTTSGLVSFAYSVYLGQKLTDVNKLTFGLSAGLINSRISAEDVDTGTTPDPVLGNNTNSIDGKFGLNYQYNNFKIGFAIPRIFETKVASDNSLNTDGISQLNNTITSISYDFRLGTLVSIEPMFTYRTFENLDPQFEGVASVKVTNAGWIGGGYRQDYGAFGFIGLNIKEKYKVGYAYEFATEQSDRIGNGSHEVQVILRLGKKHFTRPQAVHKPATPEHAPEHAKTEHKPVEHPKEEKPVVEEKKPEANEKPVSEQVVPEQIQPQPEKEKPVQIEPTTVAPIERKQEVKNLDGGNLLPGHYVVVGAFQNVQNARNYQGTLKKSGYPAHVSFHPGKGYFIVHMDNVNSLDEARSLRDKYRQMSRYSFRDTWILTIE